MTRRILQVVRKQVRGFHQSLGLAWSFAVSMTIGAVYLSSMDTRIGEYHHDTDVATSRMKEVALLLTVISRARRCAFARNERRVRARSPEPCTPCYPRRPDDGGTDSSTCARSRGLLPQQSMHTHLRLRAQTRHPGGRGSGRTEVLWMGTHHHQRAGPFALKVSCRCSRARLRSLAIGSGWR